MLVFCNTTYHNAKETIDNMLTNGQTDGHHQSRVLLLPIITHCFGHLMHTGYANAYFYGLIIFPMRWYQFSIFQCVITLLRALFCSSGFLYTPKLCMQGGGGGLPCHVHRNTYVQHEHERHAMSAEIHMCNMKAIDIMSGFKVTLAVSLISIMCKYFCF